MVDDYRSLDEPARVAVLTRRAAAASARCATPFAHYSELTTGELAVLHEAASAHARFGHRAVPHYVISKAESVSDVLEVAVLLKEVGLVRVDVDSGRHRVVVDIVPLFETINDLAAGRRHARRPARPRPRTASSSPAAAAARR